jgi:hypothetical protein
MTSIFSCDIVKVSHILGPVDVSNTLTALDDAIFRDIYLTSDGVNRIGIIPSTSNISISGSLIINSRSTGSSVPSLTIPDFPAQSVGTNIVGVVSYDSINNLRPLTVSELQSVLTTSSIQCTNIQPSTISCQSETMGVVCPVPISTPGSTADVANSIEIHRVSEVSNNSSDVLVLTIVELVIGNYAISWNGTFNAATTTNIFSFNTTTDVTYIIDMKVQYKVAGNSLVHIEYMAHDGSTSEHIGFLTTNDNDMMFHNQYYVKNGQCSLMNTFYSGYSGYSASTMAVNLNSIIASIPLAYTLTTADVLSSGYNIINAPFISYTFVGNTLLFSMGGTAFGSLISVDAIITRRQ